MHTLLLALPSIHSASPAAQGERDRLQDTARQPTWADEHDSRRQQLAQLGRWVTLPACLTSC